MISLIFSYPIPFIKICIPKVGLKSHNPAPYGVFFEPAFTTPPPPFPAKSLTYMPTFLKIHIPPS